MTARFLKRPESYVGFALVLCLGLTHDLLADETAVSGADEAVANPRRQKLVDQLNRKLGRMKPFQGTKKSTSDLYLIGTAEVDRTTGHADVSFQLSDGQMKTAEFLVDFSEAASQTSLRKWQVFYRLKDRTAGEQALAYVRHQYDTAVSYRTNLMKAYQAKSIRRC